MKSLTKSIFALAVFCTVSTLLAAEVKINDKVYKTNGKNFTKSYLFSTFDKVDPELKLTEKDMKQHPKHKNINGLLNTLTLKITSDKPVKSMTTYMSACNYHDRRARTYVTEYSLDNEKWTEISNIKKTAGWANINSKPVDLKGHKGVFYIRFRKVLEANDKSGLNGFVLFKKLSFSLNF